MAIAKEKTFVIMSAFLLWLISKKPVCGYEVIRVLRKEHGSNKVGPSHIYPVLAEMSRLGSIRAKKVASGKRVKKLYSITSSGRKKLLDMKRAHFREGLRVQFLREMLS
jgi:DNA-binding PadR family transcriptional regulator